MTSKRFFQVVVAATRQMGIGVGGKLPWSLPGDMSYFKKLTSSTSRAGMMNAVVMGRKTWESIPEKFRPLPGRLNIVLTRSSPDSLPVSLSKCTESGDVKVCGSLSEAMELLGGRSDVEHVFVIGGGQIFEEALARDDCEAVHFTLVEGDHACDTFMPDIYTHPRLKFWSASQPMRDRKSGTRFHFLVFTAPSQDNAMPLLPAATASRHEEFQYLDLVREVIETGVEKGDRTGTGTLSKFGAQMRFNLRHSFPLLTTKRVFWRGVAEELLWFVKGDTNAKHLQDKGIHIWDGNGSKEYLESVGLGHREEGDLGPVYGFQWRHFGAEYTDMHANYSGKGVDQLAEVIDKIKNNPNDRRIVMTAWNPAALKEMALPPCHMFCQFWVDTDSMEVSCQMYQRSCDLGLGVPFNIASYSLLLVMVAEVCGLKPGDFVHVLGDAHVYSNHVEPLEEQLRNQPLHFPQLRVAGGKKDIDSYEFQDFHLEGYACHKKIPMKMAV